MANLNEIWFLTGLGAGVLALAIAAAGPARHAAPLLATAATVAGLWWRGEPTGPLLILAGGCALLTVAGMLRSRPWPTAALLPAGAGLVGWAAADRTDAVLGAATALACLALAGAAIAATSVPRRTLDLAAVSVVTAGGFYLTVPDTEQVLVLAGVAVALCPAAAVARTTTQAAVGWTALAGVAAWCVATGALGRPASAIGGWSCVGLFLLVPLLSRAGWVPSDLLAPDRSTWRAIGALSVHAFVAIVGSRVAGPLTSPLVAAAVVAGALAVGAAALVLLSRWSPPRS